ncbi:hypothetical protein AJ78_05453 [Emergomyces pasteurianus Ep9510]|uniref:Uncharacterized protein n=1 Tax=Emergomyces pasteurianus Ep9510 TaxID=1447872 RepID=A0A1J9QG87_9EURO|nr:hypothetical protein AJ78_05453 [Emergomyces pasteurianus Ep9510]
MIRPWVSILLLALVVIASASAVDLGKRRQARSDVPLNGRFEALSVRLWPQDKYLDDYRQYGRGKRQDEVASPTAVPENPDITSRDTPGLDITPAKSDSTAVPPPTQTPTPTPSNSTTDTTPPETSSSTPPPPPPPPPPSTTETPTPPPESTITTTSSSPTPTSTSTPSTTNPPSPTTPPRESSTTFIPTTNADGSPTTITSVVVVHPSVTKSPGGGQPKPPGLQTGGTPSVGAGMERGMLAALSLSGVIALAMML